MHLLREEALVVLPRGILYRIVLRLVGLDHDRTRHFPAPGASGRLCQQLEGPFCCPVVARIEREVRQEDPDQRHAREIMSLDDHLRSDQDVRLPVGKRGQDLVVTALLRGRVRVQAQHPRAGIPDLQVLLDLLGARPHRGDVRRSALRALLHIGHLEAAVMAHELPVPVQGEGYLAVGTLDHGSAGPAGDKSRHAAPVQEQDRLLALGQPVFQKELQLFRQDRAVTAAEFLSQVRDLDFRERASRQPLRERVEAVLSSPRAVVGLQGRRRAP